jgi:hypothetical protein
MEKTKKVEKNLGLQLFGVLMCLVGFGLLFLVPVGTVAGVILIIAASQVGYKKVKIWKCEHCGYFFERAD